MSDNTNDDNQGEGQELKPIESPDTKEFEDVVLKDPEGAEYIRSVDEAE